MLDEVKNRVRAAEQMVLELRGAGREQIRAAACAGFSGG